MVIAWLWIPLARARSIRAHLRPTARLTSMRIAVSGVDLAERDNAFTFAVHRSYSQVLVARCLLALSQVAIKYQSISN